MNGPQVSTDEEGNAVFEWWRGQRKLTLYTVADPAEALLKSWGSNMETEMEFVPLSDPSAVSAAFAWLASDPSKEAK